MQLAPRAGARFNFHTQQSSRLPPLLCSIVWNRAVGPLWCPGRTRGVSNKRHTHFLAVSRLPAPPPSPLSKAALSSNNRTRMMHATSSSAFARRVAVSALLAAFLLALAASPACADETKCEVAGTTVADCGAFRRCTISSTEIRCSCCSTLGYLSIAGVITAICACCGCCCFKRHKRQQALPQPVIMVPAAQLPAASSSYSLPHQQQQMQPQPHPSAYPRLGQM